MKENEFRSWLATNYNQRSINSRVSCCKRIEAVKGDLDQHYNRDKCSSIIEQFIAGTHSIVIDGDFVTGTSALKHALSLYVRFSSGERLSPCEGKVNGERSSRRSAKSIHWPIWSQPTENEILTSTKIASKYYKFLHPDIVKAITENNEKNRLDWKQGLSMRGIDPELYLWEGSPCAFPGVRRYAGKLEIQFFYENGGGSENNRNALKLDDNSYPKQVWSYIFRNSSFPKHGPVGYTLAHLIDHKEHKNRCADEFIFSDNRASTVLFGLYSSPANAVYVPSALYKPTDYSPVVRNLLIRKAIKLYSNVCNVVPQWMLVKEASSQDWHLDNFEWSEPVGNLDNIEAFLKFREKEMEMLFNKSIK